MGKFERVSKDATQSIFQDHEGAILILQGDHAQADADELDVSWTAPAAPPSDQPPDQPQDAGSGEDTGSG